MTHFFHVSRCVCNMEQADQKLAGTCHCNFRCENISAKGLCVCIILVAVYVSVQKHTLRR